MKWQLGRYIRIFTYFWHIILITNILNYKFLLLPYCNRLRFTRNSILISFCYGYRLIFQLYTMYDSLKMVNWKITLTKFHLEIIGITKMWFYFENSHNCTLPGKILGRHNPKIQSFQSIHYPCFNLWITESIR